MVKRTYILMKRVHHTRDQMVVTINTRSAIISGDLQSMFSTGVKKQK